jgi:hypothetical protein
MVEFEDIYGEEETMRICSRIIDKMVSDTSMETAKTLMDIHDRHPLSTTLEEYFKDLPADTCITSDVVMILSTIDALSHVIVDTVDIKKDWNDEFRERMREGYRNELYDAAYESASWMMPGEIRTEMRNGW